MSQDMTKGRADLGFADALDDFDPTEWVPKDATANDRPAPPKAATKKAAAAAGFRSREPQPVATLSIDDAANSEGAGDAPHDPAEALVAQRGREGRGGDKGAHDDRNGNMATMSSAPATSGATAEASRATAPATDAPTGHRAATGPAPDSFTAPAGATRSAPLPNGADTRPDPYRRRRTGRSTQLSIKARPETVAAFYAVADRHGWVLGEALERAVALLEREHGPDAAYRLPSSDPAPQNPGGAPCS